MFIVRGLIFILYVSCSTYAAEAAVTGNKSDVNVTLITTQTTCGEDKDVRLIAILPPKTEGADRWEILGPWKRDPILSGVIHDKAEAVSLIAHLPLAGKVNLVLIIYDGQHTPIASATTSIEVESGTITRGESLLLTSIIGIVCAVIGAAGGVAINSRMDERKRRKSLNLIYQQLIDEVVRRISSGLRTFELPVLISNPSQSPWADELAKEPFASSNKKILEIVRQLKEEGMILEAARQNIEAVRANFNK